ncbi:MAG TPA: hypothetical protein VKM55_07730 [Candidatus Lokiarchaeia archaeon]|nr:hypothetical protein [Candidatus Lokiarchaeia archaeon]
MTDEGSYFTGFVNDVEKIINDHFSEGSIIDVKNIRHLMEIPAKNRSKTAFIAKALDNLSKRGVLTYIDQKPTKRYKKVIGSKTA